MAFNDVKNTAYNQLIAMAGKKILRQSTIGNQVVYFANEKALKQIEAIGITPTPAGQSVLAQLTRDKIFDASGYPLTFTAKAVSEAIEQAGPKERGNYLLVGSVATNTPELPYTSEAQQDMDLRKMMDR